MPMNQDGERFVVALQDVLAQQLRIAFRRDSGSDLAQVISNSGKRSHNHASASTSRHYCVCMWQTCANEFALYSPFALRKVISRSEMSTLADKFSAVRMECACLYSPRSAR